MADEDTRTNDKIAASSYAAYSDYNKTVKAWFVAFGFGGPALFMINDKIAVRLANDGSLRAVVALFLIGAGVQVLAAREQVRKLVRISSSRPRREA